MPADSTIPTATRSRSPSTPDAASSSRPIRAVLQRGYGGVEVFRSGTIPTPSPGEHEVQIAVEAAALDRGTWHLMTGRPYLMRLLGFGFSTPKQPVAGLDVAGRVTAVGAAVTRFAVGDSVFGIANGSFAELTCAHEDKLAHAPRSIPLADCAALAVSGITAVQAIEAASPRAGERVLVLGASGGVGSYLVPIARALGAHVTGTARGTKLDFVRALGAHAVIDHAAPGFPAAFDGSSRYDVILDAGGALPVSRLRRALTDEGRLVFVGAENAGDVTGGMGRPLGALALAPFVRQRFHMLISEEHHAPMDTLARLVDEGTIRPAIDRRVPFSRLAEAMQALEAGEVRGKILMIPDAA